MIPEEGNGQIPVDDDHDKPDAWRDVCDDETCDPHQEDDDG